MVLSFFTSYWVRLARIAFEARRLGEVSFANLLVCSPLNWTHVASLGAFG